VRPMKANNDPLLYHWVLLTLIFNTEWFVWKQMNGVPDAWVTHPLGKVGWFSKRG
jgi:hypothetical protein